MGSQLLSGARGSMYVTNKKFAEGLPVHSFGVFNELNVLSMSVSKCVNRCISKCVNRCVFTILGALFPQATIQRRFRHRQRVYGGF